MTGHNNRRETHGKKLHTQKVNTQVINNYLQMILFEINDKLRLLKLIEISSLTEAIIKNVAQKCIQKYRG